MAPKRVITIFTRVYLSVRRSPLFKVKGHKTDLEWSLCVGWPRKLMTIGLVILYFFILSGYQTVQIDPRGRPTVMASTDHWFCTCHPSVRPHFSKQNKTTENNGHYWRDCGSGRVDHRWHTCLVLNRSWMNFVSASNISEILLHLSYMSFRKTLPISFFQLFFNGYFKTSGSGSRYGSSGFAIHNDAREVYDEGRRLFLDISQWCPWNISRKSLTLFLILTIRQIGFLKGKN